MRRTILAATMTAATLAGGPAFASTNQGNGVEMMTTVHRVFISTDFAHCHFEDGSGGPRPCTWNLGDTQNGVGLAYWVGKGMRVHYIWPASPINQRRSWVPRTWAEDFAQHADGPRHTAHWWQSCWYRKGTERPSIHCANGSTYTTS